MLNDLTLHDLTSMTGDVTSGNLMLDDLKSSDLMLKDLKELIKIKSVTGCAPEGDMPYGRNVYEALAYVLNLCEQYGFKTKNCNNLLGWAETGEGDELIAVLCHLDVVPAGDGWDFAPFDLTVKDGIAYGRGVVDDKGPAICAIHALKELNESGKKLNKRIRIIFGCQEECGDWEDMEYYRNNEELPSCGFTPDSDFPVVYGEKGVLFYDMKYPLKGSGIKHIKGGTAANVVPDAVELTLDSGEQLSFTGISAHGSTPEEGENAITNAMAALTDKSTKNKSSFAEKYMRLIGYATDGSNAGCGLHDEESGKLSMNIGMIDSDDEYIYLKVDTRYPVTFEHEFVEKSFREPFEAAGFTVEVTEYEAPLFENANSALVQNLVEAYREVSGRDEKPIVSGGGTYAKAMANIVAAGPVFPGEPCTEHMANERISVKELKMCKEIYKEALIKLCN